MHWSLSCGTKLDVSMSSTFAHDTVSPSYSMVAPENSFNPPQRLQEFLDSFSKRDLSRDCDLVGVDGALNMSIDHNMVPLKHIISA